MADLVEFLRARLDEDEEDVRTSRALAPGDLHWSMPTWLDRNRVLAEVEAKRRILELHPLANDPAAPPYCETCRYIDDEDPYPEAGYPCPTVRALALPFSGHPDYDETWRPT